MTELARQTHDILRVNGARWRALATLDPALLRRVPAPGEWSALQCLGHAVDTEATVFAARVRAILERVPELRRYDPELESTPVTASTDPVALSLRHADLRTMSLETVAHITEGELDLTSRHPELGAVTLGELLNEWSAHDLMHLVQAERAIMQAFIPGSGPWRPYFSDHDVDVPTPTLDAPA